MPEGYKTLNPLDDDNFRQLISLGPLVSIDFLIKNLEGHILLGKRQNAPAKGFYFVPGGRIRKNETIERAIERISKTELGVHIGIDSVEPLGFYEQFYNDNFFGDVNFGTHYIAHLFSFKKPISSTMNLDDQHDFHVFMTPEEALTDSLVHPYVKEYLRVLAPSAF